MAKWWLNKISRRQFTSYMLRGSISLAIVPTIFSSCGGEKSVSISYPTLPGSKYKIGPYFTTLYKTVEPIEKIPGPDDPAYSETDANVGKWKEGDGDALIKRTDHGIDSQSKTQYQLLYFVQITDIHLTDIESPLRVVTADAPSVTEGAYRLQTQYSKQVLNSMIRTINNVAKPKKFDFLFATGDLIDNDEYVEARWFIDSLDGKVIHPETGEQDDPIPGPGNDFDDPYQAWGLDKDIPWYAVIGNHDLRPQGTFFATENLEKTALGNTPLAGTQSGAEADAPKITNGDAKVPADPDRKLLGLGVKDHNSSSYIAQFFNTKTNPIGHGYKSKDAKNGFYTFDPGAGFIRIIVMDTFTGSTVEGTASGFMTKDQWNNDIIPAIEQAVKDNKLIIMVSHHPTYSMDKSSEVTGEEIRTKFMSYPNLIMHLVGHGHFNKIDYWNNTDNSQGYWEIQTSSLIDFPQQARIVEIAYNGDGTGSIFTVMLDHNSPNGCMSELSRELSIKERQFKYIDPSELPEGGCTGFASDRNTELIFKVPDSVKTQLESNKSSLPTEIAALTTLKSTIS